MKRDFHLIGVRIGKERSTIANKPGVTISIQNSCADTASLMHCGHCEEDDTGLT